MKLFTVLALLSLFTFTAKAQVKLPADGRFDIWPTIPFIRGADLCNYADTYGSKRSEYLDGMIRRARGLMYGGGWGLLREFNDLYDQNRELALRNGYLDTTLESTLKSYLDGFYRDLKPKNKNISFSHVNDILEVIRAAKEGRRDNQMNSRMLAKLDYMAYGTYAFAPNCRGDIQVNVHLIGRNGQSESFIAQGHPNTVMSKIASQLFELFQRTPFPNTVRVGNKDIKILGGLNGSVDVVTTPEIAEEICATMGGRLPNRVELEIIDRYGDWSGGVSIGSAVWAMPGGKVYHPRLMRPTHVRDRWEVNEDKFFYYCVQ